MTIEDRQSGPLRITGLDGLRAISCLMVIIGHASYGVGFPQVIDGKWFTFMALFGVKIFFVISGFIITHLLLKEYAGTGSISLRLFYARRALRILPPYVLYLVAVWVCARLNWLPMPDGADFTFAALFLSNYFPTDWFLEHTWSLSVEEQFYLIWPLLCLSLLRRRGQILIALGLWLAILIPTGFVAHLAFGDSLTWARSLIARSSDLAAGAALAGIFQRYRPLLERIFRGWNTQIIRVIVLALLALVIFGKTSGHANGLLSATGSVVQSLCIACLIASCVICQKDLIHRLLNARIMVGIGLVSYSAYLWQQLFAAAPERYLDGSFLRELAWFPLNVVLPLGMAALIYFSVERPLTRIRSRLSAVQTSS